MKVGLFIMGCAIAACIMFALTIDWALDRRPPVYCFDAAIYSAKSVTQTAMPLDALYAKMCTQR